MFTILDDLTTGLTPIKKSLVSITTWEIRDVVDSFGVFDSESNESIRDCGMLSMDCGADMPTRFSETDSGFLSMVEFS